MVVEMYKFNEDGDRLDVVGDITLNIEYWDCECKNNFIQSISNKKCKVCGAYEEDCPSSRENEVRRYLKNN